MIHEGILMNIQNNNLYKPYGLTIYMEKMKAKKITNDDATLLTTAEKRKLADDNKELPEEKLGRSHEQKTYTTNNISTSFAKEKKYTNGCAKNFK